MENLCGNFWKIEGGQIVEVQDSFVRSNSYLEGRLYVARNGRMELVDNAALKLGTQPDSGAATA